MNKSLYLVYIFLLIFSSCDILNKQSHNTIDLTKEIHDVFAGTDSVSKLSVLRDKELPLAANPNFIIADTFLTFGKNITQF